MTSQIKECDGVEIVHPYEVETVEVTTQLLQKYKINVAAVNVNVKAEPEFRNGGVSSKDPKIRAKAVQMIKDAKDFADEIGANKVTCCPLGDGYEFSFQADYLENFKRLIDTFGEASSYKKHIPLFVEYKRNETRGRCYIDNATKTLWLLQNIGKEGLGVTMDYGHSLYGDNNPSEELSLLHHSGYPYYVHINDNDRLWDWDYFCASKNYIDYVEFVYYLKKYNYTDYLTSDTSPTRWDIIRTFETNTQVTNKISALIDRIGMDVLDSLREQEDYTKSFKIITEKIFGLV